MGVLFRAYRLALAIAGCLFFFSCGGSKSNYDYTIAFDPAWYALGMPGKEPDLTAFTTELIMEIGKIERVKIGVYERSWSNLMYALQEGQCDAICSTMQPYLFYEKLYRFSHLYLMTGPVLVTLAKSPARERTQKILSLELRQSPGAETIDKGGSINSIQPPLSMSKPQELSHQLQGQNILSTLPKPLEKLNGAIIGIQRESSGALVLEKYPGIIQRTYDSVPKALIDTTKSEIDGTLVDILSAEAYTRDLFQGQLKIVTPPLTQEGFRILAMKNHKPELIRIFDRGLSRLKSDGKYAALAKKWRLAEPLEK